jgi:hypothetical protein
MLSDKKKALITLAVGALLGAAASVTFAVNAKQDPKQNVPASSQVSSAVPGDSDVETNDGPDASAPKAEQADPSEVEGQNETGAADTQGDSAGENKDDANDQKAVRSPGHEGAGGDGDGETKDDAPTPALK